MDINKVTTAMIDYYQRQPKRIQHFLKVHAYAKLIGEQEGLDKEILDILEVAALTHDIGIKISEENTTVVQENTKRLKDRQLHSRCWKTYNMTKQKQTESAI